MTNSRRAFLAGAGSVAALSVAGCLGSDDGSDGGDFALSGEAVLPVPVAGDPDADVTVMTFEDFGCGHCYLYKTTVYPDVKESYVDPGEIRYEHHDCPIPADENWSYGIAGAARSVRSQAGDDAFWAFAERIYEHQGEYSNDAIVDVVEAVNEALSADVDPDAVLSDVDDGTYREDLEAERGRAIDAGVEGTPTIVVEGSTVDPVYDDIAEAIDDAM